MTARNHERTLVAVIVLLLIVQSLHALALMTLAKRVTVFYLPPRLEQPAPKPAPQPEPTIKPFRVPTRSALNSELGTPNSEPRASRAPFRSQVTAESWSFGHNPRGRPSPAGLNLAAAA